MDLRNGMGDIVSRRRAPGRARSRVRRRAAAVVLAVALTGATVPAADAGPAPRAGGARPCVTPARAFNPTTATIPAIGRSVGVLRVRRTPSGAVGAPPVSDRGKWLMSRDPQRRPGGRKGTVIMAAHTWPDGTALGNALLGSLQAGDLLVLGSRGGKVAACYQVTRRREYAVNRVPRRKALRSGGPERVVIIVCSGTRLGPGRWTHRTLWYATPVPDR
ncbi:class F sortase [Nocardioides daeguensis]|uniref:Class F sortase n=1 Tax=Nocardioides daeguensis TaxID=908359 RepID=A0ABP6V8I1_9ACTN|nr:class F sortase [Nocardioides daeguensis]MBV6726428.1 class F sortase [Nocardioides daeguensis]MCR1772271.1 class F sortase [Nocardioides daeguensis]